MVGVNGGKIDGKHFENSSKFVFFHYLKKNFFYFTSVFKTNVEFLVWVEPPILPPSRLSLSLPFRKFNFNDFLKGKKSVNEKIPMRKSRNINFVYTCH